MRNAYAQAEPPPTPCKTPNDESLDLGSRTFMLPRAGRRSRSPSSTLRFLLMYSTALCSYYNSALTTAVVGAIKNVSVAYIGMLVGGDYIFSLLNFIGLNICMAGGLRYSFLTLSSQLKPKQPVDEESIPLDLKS